MNKNLLKNIKLNLFITIVVSILTFILNRYFIKYMGVESLGLMNLFTQIIAYLSLAELGVGSASAYALYKPLAENDSQKISIVISTIDKFYKRIALTILIIGSLFSFLLPFILKEGNIYGNILYLYWLLYVINTSLTYIYAKFPILFTANQEIDRVRLIQGSGRIIFILLKILIIAKYHSFILFILIMISENIYLYILYIKHYKDKYQIEKTKEIDKNILKDSKNLFWHSLAGKIVFNTDYIVLSKFTSLAIVGIYSSYLLIYQGIMTIVGVISTVLNPTIGRYVAINPREKSYLKWQEIFSFYFFLGSLLIICIFYLINPFINLWLGKEYLFTNLTVTLILVNLFIQIIRGPLEAFKTAFGFFNDIHLPILEAGINLVLSLILVQNLGVDGVIIGTIVSNLVVIVFMKPFLVFKICFEKKEQEYLNILLKYLTLTALSYFLINLIIIKFINPLEILTWLEWIKSGAIIFTLSLIIIFPLYLTDKTFRSLLKFKKSK